ncbi:MAG TPA: PEP-CTERM sorting domain-containing protein [Vicinamibacterales bacterium]|nr:PEP-CTERM sorting domain-containing protein [Vicinamibacterales bacterium]
MSAIATVVLLCASRDAVADPISALDTANQITSGRYIADPAGDVFNLVGPVIELHQNAGFVTPKDSSTTCEACMAGDVVNLSFRHPPLDSAGFTRFVDLGSGDGRIGDQTYPELTFSGSLKFNATPLTFPDIDDPFVVIATPFTFRGWVRTSTTPGPFHGGTEFRLRGVGTARSGFIKDGDVYRPSGTIAYDFETAPVPEPATMFLLSTGLSALGAAGWRRRHQ